MLCCLQHLIIKSELFFFFSVSFTILTPTLATVLVSLNYQHDMIACDSSKLVQQSDTFKTDNQQMFLTYGYSYFST